MKNLEIITEELLLANTRFMQAYEIAHDEYVSKGKKNMIKSGLDNEKLRLLSGGIWGNKEESKIMIAIYNEVIIELYLTA
jgi:hypothetical protein